MLDFTPPPSEKKHRGGGAREDDDAADTVDKDDKEVQQFDLYILHWLGTPFSVDSKLKKRLKNSMGPKLNSQDDQFWNLGRAPRYPSRNVNFGPEKHGAIGGRSFNFPIKCPNIGILYFRMCLGCGKNPLYEASECLQSVSRAHWKWIEPSSLRSRLDTLQQNSWYFSCI